MGGSVSASRNRMICIARLIPARSPGNNGRRGWQASAESLPADVALLVTSRHSTAAWRRTWHLEDRRICQQYGAPAPNAAPISVNNAVILVDWLVDKTNNTTNALSTIRADAERLPDAAIRVRNRPDAF
jgi:hypothetical protein